MTQKNETWNTHDNTDILGNKWHLAPEGYKMIHCCQSSLSGLHAELKGYSALFKKLGRCEMEDGELYGLGITLERISYRLLKLSDRLSEIIVSEENSQST